MSGRLAPSSGTVPPLLRGGLDDCATPAGAALPVTGLRPSGATIDDLSQPSRALPSACPRPGGANAADLWSDSAAGRLGSEWIRGALVTAQYSVGGIIALTLAWGLVSFPVYKGAVVGFVPVALGLGLALILGRRTTRGWLTRRLMIGSDRLFVVALVILAIAVRTAAVLLLAHEPVSDCVSYHDTAARLVGGAGFGPPSVFPPGIVFWLAGVYAITGIAVQHALLANALLGGVLTWLTYYVTQRVAPTAVARLATVMVALFPSLVLSACALIYDPLLGCALLAAVALFVRRADGARHPVWYVVLIGAVCGVVCYVKPIGLLLPVVLGLAYWCRGARLRRALRNTVLLFGGMVAAVAPWIIRNSLYDGRFVGLTTTAGSGLWAANNPDATGLYMRVPPIPGMSAAEQDRYYWRAAWGFIFENPAQFAALALRKCAFMWGTSSTVMAFVSADRMDPRIEAALKVAINVAWTVVCAFFIFAALRGGLCRSPMVFWPLVALLAYTWGIHLFYEAQSRYHLPVLPVLALGAAWGWLRVGAGAGRLPVGGR